MTKNDPSSPNPQPGPTPDVPSDADGERWVGSGEFFDGIQIYPLDDDLTPMEAFSIFHFKDAEGDRRWAYRTTPQPNKEELLGALIIQAARLEEKLIAGWEGSDG